MKRTTVNITSLLPINREKAAAIAKAASRYECTFLMEHGNSILNMKSMLGLLSQSFPQDGVVTLAADGVDEEQAMEEVLSLLL
ncbi:MAG: HPr family phosphocarrier protein [Eubacteriales bacterium]|nr:HPr family phosphocarrier protein [Eubacteriales bacterium]